MDISFFCGDICEGNLASLSSTNNSRCRCWRVAVAASRIVSQFIMKQKPSGNDLVLTGFVWLWEECGDKYCVYTWGVATNIGSKTLKVTRVYASINGKEYILKCDRISLEPDEYTQLFARGKVDELPPTSTLPVFVEWYTIDKCSTLIAYAKLRGSEYLFRTITMTVPVYSRSSGATTTVTVTPVVEGISISIPTGAIQSREVLEFIVAQALRALGFSV